MLGDSALILAAGMQRSASTWLYNVARLIVCSSPAVAQQFSCGWVGDLKDIPEKRYMLIKVHGYNERLVELSRFILYSYRDIRDVIASLARKFDWVPSMQLADGLVEQHEKWTRVAQFVMKYESMLNDKEVIVLRLARMLGFDDVDPVEIIRQTEELGYHSPGPKNGACHAINLYHPGHMTDGRHGSWKSVIEPGLVRAIEDRHREWFERHGYPLGG